MVKLNIEIQTLHLNLLQFAFSHNEDTYSTLEFDKNYLCAENTYACLPLIAIVLRVADILDFDAKRTPDVLFSHLYVRRTIINKRME